MQAPVVIRARMATSSTSSSSSSPSVADAGPTASHDYSRGLLLRPTPGQKLFRIRCHINVAQDDGDGGGCRPRITCRHLASLAAPTSKCCLAIHIGGHYVAFTGREGRRPDGASRQESPEKARKAGLHVVNLVTGQELHLCGMKGAIVDLAFAHDFDKLLLASVDEFGDVLVTA
jgi:hypothetical protein